MRRGTALLLLVYIAAKGPPMFQSEAINDFQPRCCKMAFYPVFWILLGHQGRLCNVIDGGCGMFWPGVWNDWAALLEMLQVRGRRKWARSELNMSQATLSLLAWCCTSPNLEERQLVSPEPSSHHLSN